MFIINNVVSKFADNLEQPVAVVAAEKKNTNIILMKIELKI